MTNPTATVESQSSPPEPLAGKSLLSLSSRGGGQHLTVVCSRRADAPAMLRELVAAVPSLASASRAEAEETTSTGDVAPESSPDAASCEGLSPASAMRKACADLVWSRGEALIGLDLRASIELRELAERIGALPVPSGSAPETSLRDAVQAQERPAAAPQRKVGDAHIDLTLDASDVTGKLDQLDERLGKTLALADRVAGIVTLGDLAAAINAASSVLGVLTGPDSWADTATRQRATNATLAMVERTEQLVRGT